ncbi:MAG: 2Fe-2S iron-sulfur cluster binding domain-containing protein [Alphaproteobacteria bacterium]|nr:2Fe-2S iron-sulfur cluster binding domain-containing protein [Alphaproteobacteria bacterium]
MLSDPDEERVRLTLLPPAGEAMEVQVPAGTLLADASAASARPILTRCEDGRCGGCVVEDLGGVGLSAPDAAERDALALNGTERAFTPPRERLACHARVEGAGARVQLRALWTPEDILGAGPPLL